MKVHTWAQAHCRCLFLANTIQRNDKQVFRCRSVNMLSLADNGRILDIVNISVFWEFRWISRSAMLRHIAVCKTWPCYRLFCQRSSMFTPQARVTKSFSFKLCSDRAEPNASIAFKWASIVFSIEIDFARSENKSLKPFHHFHCHRLRWYVRWVWTKLYYTCHHVWFHAVAKSSVGLASHWQVKSWIQSADACTVSSQRVMQWNFLASHFHGFSMTFLHNSTLLCAKLMQHV